MPHLLRRTLAAAVGGALAAALTAASAGLPEAKAARDAAERPPERAHHARADVAVPRGGTRGSAGGSRADGGAGRRRAGGSRAHARRARGAVRARRAARGQADRRRSGQRRQLPVGRGAAAVLRFRLPRLERRPRRVLLRVFVERGGGRYLRAYRVTSRWSERRLQRRPRRLARRAVAGERRPGYGWVELDVTRAVRRGGRHAFMLTLSGRRRAIVASSESPRLRRRPRLVVEAEPAPEEARRQAPTPAAPPPPPPPPPPPSPPPPPPQHEPEPPPPPAPDVSAEARAELIELLGDVTAANAHRYGAVDDRGDRLDALKVIQTGPAAYLGVYHAIRDGAFDLNVATSTELLTWTHAATLDDHASQGTIAALPGGGYLVAYEKSGPDGVNVRFRHYVSLAALLAGTHDRELTAPRTLAPTAEGTPSIAAIRGGPGLDSTRIDVGLHYYRDADVDRQAGGVLSGFSAWETAPSANLNAAFEPFGVGGNIGDRDHIAFDGFDFNVHEAQLTKGDWSSWRAFLYDHARGEAFPLEVRTHGGSRAFGNPTVTRVTTPDGRPALVATLFLFHEGAATGEAGPLIYVRTLD